MAKSRFMERNILLTTSLSKTPRVKPSAPTSLDTRSDASANKSGRVSSAYPHLTTEPGNFRRHRLMAQSRHAQCADECPLLGAKPTFAATSFTSTRPKLSYQTRTSPKRSGRSPATRCFPRHHWGYFHIYAGRGTSKLAADVGHRWEETRYRIVELVAGRAS